MNFISRNFFLFVAALFLAGLACQAPSIAPPGELETSVAEALADAETATAAAGLQLTAEALTEQPPTGDETTLTPEASATPAEPTETATPGIPLALLTENTHCRTGPSIVYKLVRTFNSGDSSEILGKNLVEDYWFVKDPINPANGCWLWGRYVQTSGDIVALPVFTPPPTPGPDWSGDWVGQLNGGPFTMSLSQSNGTVSGTLDEGLLFPLSGSTSNGAEVITGIVFNSADPTTPILNFTWQILENRDQFIGKFENVAAPGIYNEWCGARNGAALPAPCQLP